MFFLSFSLVATEEDLSSNLTKLNMLLDKVEHKNIKTNDKHT